MKIKYLTILLVISASSLLVQCKKDAPGCTDSNAFNFDADADINCCCEYLITYDPEGTGNQYTVTWKDETGAKPSLGNQSNIWEYNFVATLGSSVSFSVTNLSLDSTSTAVANIWKGDVLFKTATVTGTGQTASVSGIVN